jgi:hypothetical protein
MQAAAAWTGGVDRRRGPAAWTGDVDRRRGRPATWTGTVVLFQSFCGLVALEFLHDPATQGLPASGRRRKPEPCRLDPNLAESEQCTVPSVPRTHHGLRAVSPNQ